MGLLVHPYVANNTPVWLPAEPGARVVLLGDTGGLRTTTLATAGHPVTFIDKEPMQVRLVRRKLEREVRRPEAVPQEPLAHEWVDGDWYHTSHRARYVEAFYPLSGSDTIWWETAVRVAAIEVFLEDAVHTKLDTARAGASVFVVSEEMQYIHDIARLVSSNPCFQLLDWGFGTTQVPILGGYDGMDMDQERRSWVLYTTVTQTV